MVSVAGVQTAGPRIGSARKVRGAGGFALADPEAVRAENAAPVTGTAPAAVAGMLVLQQVDDEPPRDRAARRHGQAVLDVLSALQRALLLTGSAPDVLDRLVGFLESVPEPDDPQLRSLIQSVLLRAHVELAKHGR